MAIFPSVSLFLLAVGLALLTILTRRKIKESYIEFRAIAYSYDLMSSSFRPGQNTYHFTILGVCISSILTAMMFTTQVESCGWNKRSRSEESVLQRKELQY